MGLINMSLLRRRASARNFSYTPNPTGGKHTISTFVDQTRMRSRQLSILRQFVFLHKNGYILMDGPVDLVGGGGGGVEEFVKKNCRAPKGHKKKFCTRNIVKKKLHCRSKHQTL